LPAAIRVGTALVWASVARGMASRATFGASFSVRSFPGFFEHESLPIRTGCDWFRAISGTGAGTPTTRGSRDASTPGYLMKPLPGFLGLTAVRGRSVRLIAGGSGSQQPLSKRFAKPAAIRVGTSFVWAAVARGMASRANFGAAFSRVRQL